MFPVGHYDRVVKECFNTDSSLAGGVAIAFYTSQISRAWVRLSMGSRPGAGEYSWAR